MRLLDPLFYFVLPGVTLSLPDRGPGRYTTPSSSPGDTPTPTDAERHTGTPHCTGGTRNPNDGGLAYPPMDLKTLPGTES